MIVALQYYENDRERTLALARLLADIEPIRRSDVLLMLISQPDTPIVDLTTKTLQHCARKFEVAHVASKRGDHGHPVACTALWTGAMEYFRKHYPNEAVFMVDGNDGVPLHLDWIAKLQAEHDRTLEQGLLITGTPYWLGGCPLHVNPNAVFQMSVLEKEPSLLKPPVYDGTLLTHFDIYHRQAMLRNTSLSTVVRTDWQGAGNKISVKLMTARASEAVWLHGYKDDELYWTTRKFLYGTPAPLELKRFNLTQLRLEESIRFRQQAAIKSVKVKP